MIIRCYNFFVPQKKRRVTAKLTYTKKGKKADEVIEELFQSFLSRYQIGLETSMKSSDFIFNCVH